MERESQIDQARNEFMKLIRQQRLPPKMEAKLRYLEAGALGQQPQSALIQELPQFEKLSLQMMSRQTKSSLFNSIVNCLAGKDLVTYFTAEPSAIKREDSSARSTPCFLSCTSESLSVCKNKDQTQPLHLFPISKLLVAKIYHRDKKHFVFGIAFDGVKYRFKFEHEGPCARIHGDLLAAIREKRSLRLQSEQKRRKESEVMEQLQVQSQWDETGQQLILEEQKQYLKVLINKIQQSSMDSTENYQLVRNIDSGKIMVNAKTGKVKILMFLERCSLEGLIESYIQFASWNVQVQHFEITKRIRHNTFLAHIKLKKKNIFSSPREGSFTITYFKHCACFRGSHYQADLQSKFQVKHYLVLSPAESFQEKKTGVPMKFNQIIQFAEVEGRPGIIFISILSYIDFNLYQYFQSSTDMNLQFLQEVGSIAVLCRERQIMKSNSCQLFEFGLCVCQRKKKRKQVFQSFSAMKAPEGENRKNSIFSEPDHRSLPFEEASPSKHQEEIASIDFSFKEITSIIADHNEMKIEARIVEVIEKKMFERYYLKQKFSEELHEKPYIQSQYRIGERVNYLSIGDRWKFNKSEEFIFIDQEVLNLQKGVLKLIIKQITSNILSGKSIMSMSLPVELFDDYSILESFARLFGYAPVYMNKAVKETQLQQQIKYVMLAFVFLLSCDPKVSKPFNPILGQTLQGSIGGIPFYMEQISHHPPITTFFMKNQHFEAHGNIDLIVEMGFNAAHSKMPGPFKVKIYSNNTEYFIKFPQVELGGVMVGDRCLRPSGRGYVLEKNSGTYLEYSFGKDKKKLYEYKTKIKHPDLAGGIFRITQRAVQRLLSIDKKKSVEGIKPEEALQQFSLISGKWYGDVCFDGKCYKSMKNGPFPIQFQRETLLLPSDATFRLDIVYRRWRDFKKSNQEKEVLENLQRRDRKLRQKYHPNKKH